MGNREKLIKETIANHPVVLFMKGTKIFPQCGFSDGAVKILKEISSKEIFSINVLEDESIRQAIKSYSNWPTIPQLYVNGEFVGGYDIMKEMLDSGELRTLLDF